MKNITKKRLQEYVKARLGSDKRWALRALEIVYSNQTNDEKIIGVTKYNNGIGFTGNDAEMLTTFAQQYLCKNYLTSLQMQLLFKMISKYWRQVLLVANVPQIKAIITTYWQQITTVSST